MSFQDKMNGENLSPQAREVGVVYVFDTEPMEDRAESLKEGRIIHKDVDVCRVYRSGDQSSSVKWVIPELMRDQPTKFLRIKDQYSAWKRGQTDEPLHGTSLRMWPAISKAQAENLWQLNIRTVEDLSQVPDNLLPQLGIGAQALKQKAVAWLNSAGNIGKVAEQIATLTARLGNLEDAIAEKDVAIAEKDKLILELTQKLGETPRRGPGRPPKQRPEDEAA